MEGSRHALPTISVIVRTRNEERWIAHCIKRIREQTIENVEIVLVDNESKDRTIERALNAAPDLRLVTVKQFRPGLAINEGIRAAHGDYIVCLSAHCLPVGDDWLESLLANFPADGLAGVYGRQVPMRSTSAANTRDLLVTFGLDRRVQRKDPFFHNANSMFPRSIWEQFPFDEEVQSVEDRVWARHILDAGYWLVYDPEPAVYHHHGIHQDNDSERAERVVRVMHEHVDHFDPLSAAYELNGETLETVAMIPIRKELSIPETLFEILTRMTIDSARQAKLVNRIIVFTASEELAEKCHNWGAEIPFLRPAELADPGVKVDHVLADCLHKLENDGYFPDLALPLEITQPFRAPKLLDSLIEHLVATGLDTVIAGKRELRPCWQLQGKEYVRVDDYDHPRDQRSPITIGLPSLGCATYPEFLRAGNRLGKRVGIVTVADPTEALEVRSEADLEIVRALAGRFWTESYDDMSVVVK